MMRFSCEPTYKELKRNSKALNPFSTPCCEPTYKELKLSQISKLIKIALISCEPTYKELKQISNFSIIGLEPWLRAYL